MDKKIRIGSDPLSWIKDSRDEEDSKHSLQSKPSKHIKQGLQNKLSKTRTINKTSQIGLPEGWTRATFIVREEYLDKIKSLAYWDRKGIKEVIDDTLRTYFDGKKIKPIKLKRR